MKTKFTLGQKIYQVKDENVFILKVTRVDIEISKEWTTVEYVTERKERVGLLDCDTYTARGTEESKTLFATKKEAVAYIGKIKEARDIVRDADSNTNGFKITNSGLGNYCLSIDSAR